jgi:hypothetical protein
MDRADFRVPQFKGSLLGCFVYFSLLDVVPMRTTTTNRVSQADRIAEAVDLGPTSAFPTYMHGR